MSSNSTAGLFFLAIGTTMNGLSYRKMLVEKLKIRMAIDECNMFKEGGPPCHRLKLVSDFLKKNNIKKLNWRGNSVDINLIENLWAIPKDKAAEEHPTSAKDLKMAIKRI